LGIEGAEIASNNGVSITCRTAHAQTVHDKSWELNCSQLFNAAAAIASIKGGCFNYNLASDHAGLDKL